MMARSVGFDDLVHDPGSVLTVGTFDGVHRGHQALLALLVERARQRNGPSRVLTFDPHPREVVRGERVFVLSTLQERAQWIGSLGVDELIIVPFTQSLARMSAAGFVQEVLVNRVGLQEIVVGYDFAFGHGREGNGALLGRLGQELDFTVHVLNPQVLDSDVVSSSEIRRTLIQDGNVRRAATLLGRSYEMTARVVPGAGRGRQIGYPTANLEPVDPRKIVPAQGVYAVQVNFGDEASWVGGMMNIGTRPTFAEQELRIEVHLFDFQGDLYGERLRVSYIERLRAEKKFHSVEELVEQLSRDEQRCRAILSGVSY